MIKCLSCDYRYKARNAKELIEERNAHFPCPRTKLKGREKEFEEIKKRVLEILREDEGL